MSNPEHVQIVKQGIEAFKKWRTEKNPFGLLDLSSTDLRGINLSQFILIGCNFHQSILSECDFSEALLNSAKMNEVDLSDAKLCRAKMSGTNLRNANLSDADLTEADLSGNDSIEACLVGANLRNTVLKKTNLAGVVVEAEDWFECLKQRNAIPRDIEKLETLWITRPAGGLKIVAAGRLEPPDKIAPNHQWYQLWHRDSGR